MYSDAHIHLFDIFNASGDMPAPLPGSVLCASSHSQAEFVWQESLARVWPGQIRLSFGIHPQEPVLECLPFLEQLVADRRIAAVGECGFDQFDDRFRSTIDAQRAAWDAQLEVAHDAGLPIIVHCRKALDLVFADAKRLKELKAVVFHGWPGSAQEAASFLDRGVNAYFSCGKGMLRGDRSLKATIASLPIERVLTETDAPWMTLRGEEISIPADIRAVTAEAAALRGMDRAAFSEAVFANFIAVFG